MANLEYGTADFYAEGFSDYLADLDANDPKNTENLIEGFYRALDSWFEYQRCTSTSIRRHPKASSSDTYRVILVAVVMQTVSTLTGIPTASLVTVTDILRKMLFTLTTKCQSPLEAPQPD
jgi:hypothetical protein